MANVVEIIIDARDRTRSAFNSVRGGVSNLISSVRDKLGGAFEGMSDMMSTGLGGAFKAAFSNPYTAAAAMIGVAALVSTLAPLIALALGGALTVAMGGAFVGIGAMMLTKNKKVKADFAATFKDVGQILQRAFQPLMPVLDTVRGAIKTVAEAFEPFIKQASAQIAPHLVSFIDNLATAAIALAPALGPMMDAFGKILDELGPELPGMMTKISGALIKMFEAVGENADTFVLMIEFVVNAITGAIIVIGWLIDQVGKMKDTFEDAKALGGEIWDKITDGASKAKEKVTEVVDKIKRFASGTYRAALTAVDKTGGVVSGAVGAARRFATRTYRAALTAVNRAGGAISNAAGAARRFASGTYRAALTAINRVWDALNDAISAGNRWAGRVFTATFNVVKSIIPGFAHGGIVGAAGGGPRSSLVMVGEQGRELVRLPFGSTVVPNGQTESMLAGGGGGRTVLEWGGGPTDELGRALWNYFKKNVRAVAGTGDGSVQRALGT